MVAVELAARSHYSFLEGSSSPRTVARTAAALGIAAVGLCDRSGLYGAVEFTQAAAEAGVQPIIGTELELADGSRLRLLARDRTGYRQLCRAVSAAQLAGIKAQPRVRLAGLDLDDVPAAASRFLPPPQRPRALRPTAGPFPQGWPGLPSTTPRATGDPAGVDPADLSGCIALAGGAHSTLVDRLVRGDRRGALRHAERLRECFGPDRAAILLTHHLHPADTWIAAECAHIAERAALPIVASATPDHASVDDKPLLDVLTAIRHRTTLDQAAAHGLLLPNSEHRLQSEATMRERLRAYPEAFDTAARIAAECSVSLDFSDVRFPGFPVPDGETPFSVLYALCQESVQRKYHPMTRQVAARLQRELDVIEKTGLAEFFLITWDIMRFAREQGIPGQGRGSAADSIVAYLLGITRVDPVAHDLLFERFLHEDHQGTPDIDIDFSTDHRERVLQYVYDKYGADRTGMVANVVTFRPRMAIRQAGAAMGFPETIVDRLAKGADGWYMATLDETLRAGGAGAGDTPAPSAANLPWRQFLEVLKRIEGTPRHLSIHVGGMLVTGEPLVDVVPVERATMPGRVVVQFDKDDVEDLGLIKMDLLGLRTLSAIAECLDLIEQTTGARPDLDALPLDDPRVYDMICRVDTIGLFQIESRAQQQSLWQSQPREFNDLIVQVAIIRPGPIQGDAVHPYLRRRQRLEPVTYLHPKLEPILAETKGVILYQEQILRIVMDLAGYTAGEADRFRRAMNRHRSRLEMEELRGGFLERCSAKGLALPVAEQIFKSVAGFAEFGFCKSHAAAFARTAYETAWLRLEYPAHYTCALLNAQPMGFYAPSVLVDDARRHGVKVLPVDVTRSRARCTVEVIDERGPGREAVVDERGMDEEDVCPRRVPREKRPSAKLTEAQDGEAACSWRVPQASEARRGLSEQANTRPPRPQPQLGSASRFAIRLGFAYVRGLGPAARAACDDAVVAGAIRSVEEFWRHTLLPRAAMENLVKVGAFDSVADGLHRRQLLWELKRIEESLPRRRRGSARDTRAQPDAAPAGAATPSDTARIFGPPRGSGAIAGARFGDAPHVPRDLASDPPPPMVELPAPTPPLPPMDERTRVTTEYALTQVSTGPHLISFIREQLQQLGCTPLAEARTHRDGSGVRVAGLVITRQAPMSASGFRFFTLSDEEATLDLVFRPDVAARTRDVARHPLLMVDGVLQVENGRINVVVRNVTALDRDGHPLADGDPLPPLTAPRAHNFR